MATRQISLAFSLAFFPCSLLLMQLCEGSPAAGQRSAWESCRTVPRETCWSDAPHGPAGACWHPAPMQIPTAPSREERDGCHSHCLPFVRFCRARDGW